MFKLYLEAFKTTNDAIILAVPLALFWWVISLYINYSFTVVDTLPEVILSVITMLFMTSAFCSGWFYMVKKSVIFSKKHFIMDNDRTTEAIRLIRAIPKGLGRFFLHYVVAAIVFISVALLLVMLVKGVTYPFVTQINDTLISFGIRVSSPQEMDVVLDKLSPDKLMMLFDALFVPAAKLVLAVIAIPAVFSFLLMLWMPEIIYTRRNPIIALFTSMKKVFLKFGKSVHLYIYTAVIQMLVSSVGACALINPLTYMISMIIYFYFFVYVVVLIFSYYDANFIRTKE
ncbi:hypothetical protein IKP85_00420 [bacterium]|nr:hypothetical protein [bacterium]